MKTVVAILLAIVIAYPGSSTADTFSPTFTVGGTLMKSYFENAGDWDCFFNCSDFDVDDDTDTGGEVFFKVGWGSLLVLKLGYIDHGEFDFVEGFLQPDVRGSGEASLTYAAWAPQWNINKRFSLTGAIGAGIQDVDVDVDEGLVDIDDGTAVYTSLGVQYRLSDHFALHTEAGYSFGEDIDVGWLGFGGSYRF